MEIREAFDDDIPAIVDLLKHSLGESLIPKSVEYWTWKHVDNPFGKSPVLLCIEGSQIIGVRAFMQWQWTDQENVYKAVRAVDTATHPAHQGKGIFKKLTLKLVDQCKQNGIHFVFNTPNAQSKPGYLKMGWEEAGRLPISAAIRRPFNILQNLIKPQEHDDSINSELDNYLNHEGLDSLIAADRSRLEDITTNVSSRYLSWRYLNVPVAHYIAVGQESGKELRGLVIVRIKDGRFGRELRIADSFFQNDAAHKNLMRRLAEKAAILKVDYITSSAVAGKRKNNLGGVRINGAIGPIVTVRSLSLNDLYKLKEFRKWSPSIGDLELF